ncbi:phosphatase PAP2 family protein [Roseovarius sp. SYSU LYC5161]|uniref:phosphatase PAP2 family protein n=1 Tax=Roseovarius halophilus (ex Wu et al. 2025) TaxID=3376060 RepID=UPI00399B7D1A
MERVANSLYLIIAAAVFGWTWASPGVTAAHFARPLLDYTHMAVGMWAVGGLILVCCALLRQALTGGSGPRLAFLRHWVADHWRESRFAHVLGPALAFVVTMASFTVHKTVALPAQGFGAGWDAAFIALDRWLFLGAEPWRVSHGVLSSAEATWLIDRIYHAWFYPMILAYVFCGLMIRGALARACYIATYLASWGLIGCVLAVVFASAGPVYEGLLFEAAGEYDALSARLAAQSQAMGGLDSRLYQQVLLEGHEAGRVAFGFGISAMPSMHVALAAMWAMLFFSLNRWLGLLGTAYTVVIWVGSFHLGWHYAADGLVSGGLVVVVWAAASALLRRFAPAPGPWYARPSRAMQPAE